ncbi:uncharacterized protein LOC110931097 [Helianthus annuus]|uniref:uncharacterized protein LOC110931097 n=1 Tax=Helianthus annuus TaxID=4232 RepID=UPI000B908B1E|nr:uncharacterized protein LOC110931097 [Helianthus annuus]
MESKLHPAATVTHIKNFITVTLDMDTAQYSAWSELFRIQCRAYLVSDHLTQRKPSTTASASKDGDKDNDTAPKTADSWERIDAIVLQWIYGTISSDLLHTILKTNTTAYDAWHALQSIFQDNKAIRAIHLKNKFSNTRLENFPNVSAYYQELKVLADQLSNVDAPIDDNSLVLQVIAGLTEQFDGIATILQQTKPLPSFYEARSQICLEETRKANQAMHAASAAATALAASTNKQPPNSSAPNQDYRTDQYSDRNRGRGNRRGRGRGRSSGGRGRGQPSQQTYGYPHWGTHPTQWAGPPPFQA